MVTYQAHLIYKDFGNINTEKVYLFLQQWTDDSMYTEENDNRKIR